VMKFMLANPNKFCKTNDRFALEVCLKFAKLPAIAAVGAFLLRLLPWLKARRFQCWHYYCKLENALLGTQVCYPPGWNKYGPWKRILWKCFNIQSRFNQ